MAVFFAGFILGIIATFIYLFIQIDKKHKKDSKESGNGGFNG